MSKPSPVESFVEHVVASLQAGTLVRLLLSKPAAGTSVERIIGRLVDIRGESMLSLTLREAKRDSTRNLPLADVAAWLREQLPAIYTSAVVETTERTWQLHPLTTPTPASASASSTAASAGATFKLSTHRPRAVAAPSRSHDRPKATWLDDGARAWLTQLGLLAADGRVRASMADKHHQLERFLEIMEHLVRDCGWQPGERVTVADMGSGKGYLTFGLWHLLTKHLRVEADVLGIEARADLVDAANHVARAVGATTLRFEAGVIAEVASRRIDVLVALHACNTATDDAIRRGIEAQARLIVVSPCCHQEVRPQLQRPEPFAGVLAHGIMAERLSEWLTDGLRVLHLEAAGYATRAIEFVASAHTPRNLLLAGVRRARPDAGACARAAAEIERLKTFFGIEHQALDASG